MSVAQWAPWLSVFLGGCLSGAALLSLSNERAAETKHVVTVSPPAPSEPSETQHAPEASDESDQVAEADLTTSHHNPVEPDEPADFESGPSAADILAALEQAYQRQVAGEAAQPEATIAEATPRAEVEPEPAAAEAPPQAAPVAALAPDEHGPTESFETERRLAQNESEREVNDDAIAPAEPVQAATHSEPTVQQIAVVYQPVYVLPPATDAKGQASPRPPRRSVGRDPWAPLTISPRHNPWGSAGSTGAWASAGVAGGVWAGGFTSGR